MTVCNETILLVEDEDIVRDIGQLALTHYGYHVLEAGSGDEALGIVESHVGPLHLVVTDLTMPGMSGQELAERLRLSRPDLKIMFVSGYAEDHVMRHVSENGRDGFLAKPFTPVELAAKVREVLSAAG